jgi:hypothetical protein
MKKIILILFVFFVLGGISFIFGEDCVCCRVETTDGHAYYEWLSPSECQSQGSPSDNLSNCSNLSPPSTCQIPQEQFKPGEVTITWTPINVSVCPPGILGGEPCSYPSLIDLIKRINEFLLTISPPLLVILIILGGLMYLLTPLNVEEQIKKGHRFIKYAIIGYILLLLVTLIFTIISAILGGPSP